MKLEQVLAETAKIADIETLQTTIAAIGSLANEHFDEAIPSIVLSQDGPRVSRLLLVGATLICDISSSPPGVYFDFVPKRSVGNYRFYLGEISIKGADQSDISYETAKVELLHSHLPGSTTQLEYVGHDQKAWLADVIRLLPIDCVLASISQQQT